MGSVLWRMRLGEGCLGEKGLMKRLRLKGRSSTVCGKRRVCHVHNAACLYRILSCGCNASFAHLEAAAAKHNGLLGAWP